MKKFEVYFDPTEGDTIMALEEIGWQIHDTFLRFTDACEEAKVRALGGDTVMVIQVTTGLFETDLWIKDK